MNYLRRASLYRQVKEGPKCDGTMPIHKAQSLHARRRRELDDFIATQTAREELLADTDATEAEYYVVAHGGDCIGMVSANFHERPVVVKGRYPLQGTVTFADGQTFEFTKVVPREDRTYLLTNGPDRLRVIVA